VHHLCVLLDRKGASRSGLPDVLLIIVMLTNHTDLVGNEIPRIEANPKLPLHTKVLHRQVIFPIIRKRLVEGSVFLVGHILGLPHPKGLVFVQLLPLVAHLFHLLGFLLFLLFLLLLVHLLDLGLITLLAFLVLLFLFFLRVRHLFLFGLLHI